MREERLDIAHDWLESRLHAAADDERKLLQEANAEFDEKVRQAHEERAGCEREIRDIFAQDEAKAEHAFVVDMERVKAAVEKTKEAAQAITITIDE